MAARRNPKRSISTILRKIEDSEQSMNFVTSLFYRDFWTNGILAAVSENCVSPDLQMLRCNESWVIFRVYFIVLIPEYSQTTSSYISDRHFAEWEDLNSFRTTNQSYWDLDHADSVLAREPQTYFRSSLLFLLSVKTVSQFMWSHH